MGNRHFNFESMILAWQQFSYATWSSWESLEPSTSDGAVSADTKEVDPFHAEPVPMIFPSSQVNTVQLRHIAVQESLPVQRHVPHACGVFSTYRWVGTFPTSWWLADPTMPPDVKELFGGTPFFALGEYRIATMEIRDSAENLHSITIIVNKGVEGLQTGYWGGAFSTSLPNKCWAKFETTGELETTVTQQTGCKENALGETIFQGYDDMEALELDNPCGVKRAIYHTQLEQVLGLAAEYTLSLDPEEWLTGNLHAPIDTSSKLERRIRARRRERSRLESPD
eukprot:Nitzschia sp. Nitz4//scaffold7_size249615//50326//51322//NITZ4_001151-RA/size249615-snap-gene-0.221-mRNA-1//1//CDS//3329558364//3842//frame0